MKIRKTVLGKAVCADSGCGGNCRPCVREGGTRSVPEGLLVWTYNNPSVSRADSSLCTREPVLGEALYADSGRGGSLPSLCKGRWRTECTEGLLYIETDDCYRTLPIFCISGGNLSLSRR